MKTNFDNKYLYYFEMTKRNPKVMTSKMQNMLKKSNSEGVIILFSLLRVENEEIRENTISIVRGILPNCSKSIKKKILQVLISSLYDSNYLVREECVNAISEIGDKKISVSLLGPILLSDRQWTVRYDVVDALCRSANNKLSNEIEFFLIKGIKDSDSFVRMNCIYQLGLKGRALKPRDFHNIYKRERSAVVKGAACFALSIRTQELKWINECKKLLNHRSYFVVMNSLIYLKDFIDIDLIQSHEVVLAVKEALLKQKDKSLQSEFREFLTTINQEGDPKKS